MSWGINIENDVLNQKGSPAIFSDTLANRPAFGYAGRLFIGTDNLIIYRDTGTAWVALSGGGVIGADNGTTLTSGIVELGGNLIKNTSIGGAFTLSFTAGTGFGFGASGSSTHMGYFLRSSNTVPDGAAGVLGVNQFTPQSTLSTTNFYGSVGTLNLNLATSNITGASTFNASGLFGSVVVANNNGASTSRALRAVQGGFVVNGNALLDDIRALDARSPEVSGTNTITNSYGCYIDTQKVTGVTNGWGVYQNSSLDTNYFAGSVNIGNLGPATSKILTVTGGVVLDTGALTPMDARGITSQYFGDGTPLILRSAILESIIFGTNSTENMRLLHTGELLLGTTTLIASAKHVVTSTTQGFLPPRMTTTQKNAISTPAAGLIVYDTTLNKLCVYTTAWETITSV